MVLRLRSTQLYKLAGNGGLGFRLVGKAHDPIISKQTLVCVFCIQMQGKTMIVSYTEEISTYKARWMDEFQSSYKFCS